MIKFEKKFTDFAAIRNTRKPDFSNIIKILNNQKPSRFTLFEFFLNNPLEFLLSGRSEKPEGQTEVLKCRIEAFCAAGYDYTTIHASDFAFKHRNNDHNAKSISVNEGAIITNREEFKAYNWESPNDYYNGRVENLCTYLPDGMKFIIYGPGGVLENVMALTGYDNLCYMIADDEELVFEIFEKVGLRLIEYYERIIDLDCVGAIISNDDWGFNTQTMLSTSDMRKFVFPWHKKIVDLAKKANKPAILHSCGQLINVYDDIIDDIGFNGKHSYEDNIMPVEQAYEMLKGRIAVLGGIDLDFVCRKTPEEVYERACNLLAQTNGIGYGLGTGNSIPYYTPNENYLAMISAVLFN